MVTKENNASLCNQQSKLIPLLVSQVLELQPFDLRSNMTGEVGHLGGSGKECALGLVRAGTCIIVLPRLVADLKCILEI